MRNEIKPTASLAQELQVMRDHGYAEIASRVCAIVANLYSEQMALTEENKNLKEKLQNRDLNIKHLTAMLDQIEAVVRCQHEK